MIATITLNPSVDRGYRLKDLKKNGIYRCKDYSSTPGGKGINVSRVLNQLKAEVICLGFLGGFSGEFIKSQLEDLKIHTNFTKIKSETRTCIGIIDQDGSQIEILEQGPRINKDEIEDFVKKFQSSLEQSKIIIASGSLPRGVNTEIYKYLVDQSNQKGAKFILDSSKLPLIEGIKAGPYLIKPNKEELEAITKFKINTDLDIIKACEHLINMGAKNIAVSLGKNGMIFVGEEGKFKVSIPKIEVLNPVGSGDSTVSGFAVGLLKNLDIEDILKLANACGISNAMEKETGKINIDAVNELIKNIKIHKIC